MRQWLERLRGKQHRGATVIDRRELPEGMCQLCNAEGQEIRPYGPNGEWICFDCKMKDKSATEAKMGELLFGIKRH
jgi:hypothetical protein